MGNKALRFWKGKIDIVDIEVPVIGDEEVLVETKACGICTGDIHTYNGLITSPQGFRFEGHEPTGIVSKVGKKVEKVKPGDKVTSMGSPSFAQFFKTDQKIVEKIPDDVKDFAVWISEPEKTVVTSIRNAGIQIGDDVCVVGCGYMGLLHIQSMPRNINSLTAIDIKSDVLDLAKKFGADNIINSKEVDPIKESNEIAPGGYDVVVEAAGVAGVIGLATRLTRRGGILVSFGRHMTEEMLPINQWHKGMDVRNISPGYSKDQVKDFVDAVRLMRKGIIDQRLLITHRASYEEADELFKFACKKPDGYIKGAILF